MEVLAGREALLVEEARGELAGSPAASERYQKTFEGEHEKLLSSCGGSWRVKSRHKCKMSAGKKLVGSPARLLVGGAGGSRLARKLSHFLSSRNVISQGSSLVLGGYDKIVNEQRIESRGSRNAERLGKYSNYFDCPSTANNNQVANEPSRSVTRTNPHNQVLTFNRKAKKNSFKSFGTRQRLQLLIIAILTGQKGLDKTSLFLSLLRAPIVLAAVFSLLLTVSLMTLYTMSFHHHLRLRQENLSEVVPGENGSFERPVRQQHSISSRHLLQLPLPHTSPRNQIEEMERDGLLGERQRAQQLAENQSAFDRALTVQTECGAFVGSPEESSIVFKGIPYASAPTVSRRWTRPRAIWLDSELCQPKRISEMREFRSHCAQVSPMTHRFTGHEDCLYLDIYLPRLAPPTGEEKRLAPVMVYIHGGFLSFGSSGTAQQDQEPDEQVNWMKAHPSGRLASELGVILVALNYRLQALGFLTLSQLAQNNGPFGSEGNYGLWDQLTGLNWIKRNIESFGGDPNNIVLFGPDSASALPLAMLSSLMFAGGGAAGSGEPDSRWPPGSREKVPAGRGEREESGGRNWPSPVSQSEALDANQSDSARDLGELDTHDLFRAVWLTNPAVYYELPYELANQHYQRLFLNQSPCQSQDARGSSVSGNSEAHYKGGGLAGGELASRAGFESNETRPAKMTEREGTSAAAATKGITTGAKKFPQQRARPAGATPNTTTSGSPTESLLECLMGLSSEQVVRYYLGKDEPSYRLDDQNSLPIHAIFADQFVTVDQELVRRSYPFWGAKEEADLDDETRRRQKAASGSSSEGQIKSPSASAGSHKPEFKPAPELISNNDDNSNNNDNAATWLQPAARAGHYKQPGAINDDPRGSSSRSEGNYAGNWKPAEDGGGRDGGALWTGRKRRRRLSVLLGSSAQAVEFWPNPSNLNHWNWLDFKRYVETSLNSFVSSTYAQAASLYQVPELSSSSSNSTPASEPPPANISRRRSPKETYLTMVSDIRQICPINELFESLSSLLRQREPEGAASVFRYVVEQRPSKAFPVSVSDNSNNWPEFAFHNWDLIAFFGFEFERKFEPQERDLQFQAQIRQMVRRFVFQEDGEEEEELFREAPSELAGGRFLVLDEDGNRKQVSSYKREECAMWLKHLGRSYAWVS